MATTYQVGFDLDHDEVYVSYDAAAGGVKAAAAPMLAAITAAGFDPWLKRAGWPPAPPPATVLPRPTPR